MNRRIHRALALTSALVLLPAVGCDKKEDKKAETKKSDAKKGDDAKKKADAKAGDAKKPDPKPEPPKMVEMDLPKTGLKIMLPEGSTIDEAIVAGADEVTLPGVQSKMIVKPRLVTDKELDKHIEWANGHQIQKFKKEILKEGEGKTYAYMHEVDMSGMSKVVYMQMFQVGDKDFACFSNADNEDAAKTMKTACDTVKAPGGDAKAEDGKAPADAKAEPKK